MLKSVTYPKFLFSGVKANHRAYPLDDNLRIFGADTETLRGNPHTIQCYDGEDLLFKYVEGGECFDAFIDYIEPRCRNRGVNIVYFHFLRFDLPVLFFEKRLTFYEQISEIKFEYKGWDCDILFGKVNKATLRRGNVKFHILDSWAFTQAGLAASLDMYKIPHPKQEKSPELEVSIGKTNYHDLPENHVLRREFESYAKQDAVSEYHLAKAIMDKHKEYKVRPCISLPQFAARVFRHHFMQHDETIPFPGEAIIKAAEFSYHGGKNGKNCEHPDCPKGKCAIPQIIEDTYEIDISSAYPYAMASLPQFIKGSYVKVDAYDPENVGIYKVSGRDDSKYPVIFDHAFNPIRGEFKDIWVTGFELKSAMICPNVEIKVDHGYVWIHDRTYTHNPLKEYVEHFYKLKEASSKEDANYYFYKTMMNGLYGKFGQVTTIRKLVACGDKKQAVDYEWDEALKKYIKVSCEYRAGGLYNPFVASQITGFVRNYLTRLEVDHQSFHSATDAVKTTKKPTAIKGLGGVKIETFGRCYCFRNKLYLHFAKNYEYCKHDPKKVKFFDEDGQHLCKYALHGFKGKVGDLFKARHKLMRGESYEYSYKHMVGLREGFRRDEPICSMIDRREMFNLFKGKEELLDRFKSGMYNNCNDAESIAVPA